MHGVQDAAWCEEWEEMEVEAEEWNPAWKQEEESWEESREDSWTEDGGWNSSNWGGGGSHDDGSWKTWPKKEEQFGYRGGYHGHEDSRSTSSSSSKKGSYVKGGWISADGRFYPKLGKGSGRDRVRIRAGQKEQQKRNSMMRTHLSQLGQALDTMGRMTKMLESQQKSRRY
ncbi:unnamed protein product [Symbiodinium necroappetens]|uniref:Uncharacterized protein n=1 Tax=Symbiodinium necroappetens TaxID=1628268 RepID=A0A812ZN09_9DINO|nr:unnamed protein product [Symbiodinium necroappetens]